MRDKGGMEQVEEQKGLERVVPFKNAQCFLLHNFLGCLKCGKEKSSPDAYGTTPRCHN